MFDDPRQEIRKAIQAEMSNLNGRLQESTHGLLDQILTRHPELAGNITIGDITLAMISSSVSVAYALIQNCDESDAKKKELFDRCQEMMKESVDARALLLKNEKKREFVSVPSTESGSLIDPNLLN